MSFTTSTSRAASPDIVNRRLAAGVLLSIILHAMLLALQFGVPGLGLPAPSRPQPVTITLAPPAPAPPAVAPAPLAELPPPAPEPAPTGMRVLAPAPKPAPAAPVVAKPKRVKPRRINRPLPPREPVESPTRVIAQDQNPNDSFVVPLPQPEEAAPNTVDPKQAQEGSDDGADARAALVAEEQRKEELEAVLAAQAKALQEQRARESSAIQAEETRRQLAEAEKIQEQQRRSAQEQAEQSRKQQADQLAAKQQADQLAAKQQADQLAAQQQADQSARKQAEELALREKADELAARQRAADLARLAEAARQQTEQLTRQQAEQAARQRAEQVARQQAEQAAQKQAAEQAAQQQAEQAAAAAQRERERVAAATPPAGASGAGATIPKNLLGSDAGNRVRELTRGIDLLSGAPPQRSRGDDERSGRRVVVGSAERDVPLRMYVDSFRQKIERNGALVVSPMAGERVRIDPLVSVAIRSDGSVEEVTIVRSSGHTSVDDAVRRIVRVNARFSAFPPNVAARYDVIEIRRVWSFADSLKLLEELR